MQAHATRPTHAPGRWSCSLLRLLRFARYGSIDTASEALGVSRATLAAWECGQVRPSPQARARLQGIFGYEWSTLEREVGGAKLLVQRRRR